MEWKNKIQLSFLLAAVINPMSSVYAQTEHFGGFTINAGVGATTLMVDVENISSVDGIPANNTKNIISKFGGLGSISFGYGQVSNAFYFGADLGLNILGSRNARLSNTAQVQTISTATDLDFPGPVVNVIATGTTNTSLYSQTEINRKLIEPFLDFKAGYLITPNALAFIHGGIAYNTHTIRTNYTLNDAAQTAINFGPGVIPIGVSASSGLRFSNLKDRLGIRAGIGSEILITPYLGLAADYVYTFYPDVNQTSSGTVTTTSCEILEGVLLPPPGCVASPATFTSHTEAKVHDQKVMAQIIYHLGG